MDAAEGRFRRIGQVIGLLALLAAAIWLLTAMGRGPLRVPSLWHFGAWGPWLADRDALTSAFALLRVATLALAWYLLGATLVGVAARLARGPRLVAIADAVTVPMVRRLLQSALGVGLATASLTAGSGDGPAPARVESVATAQLPSDPIAMTPLSGDALVMQPFESHPAQPPAVRAQQFHDSWTVDPGDHFWSIAETALRRAWEREPTDDETAAYWEELIAANRQRLIDPGNPDLIQPGQVFVLPPPPRR
jgi:nucleoid-associated protein YgaU